MSPLRKETTDVLVEVVYLIERLEADRQDAEEALQSEKKRRRTLGRKMYSISLWKQQEFPVAVQKGQLVAKDKDPLKKGHSCCYHSFIRSIILQHLLLKTK